MRRFATAAVTKPLRIMTALVKPSSEAFTALTTYLTAYISDAKREREAFNVECKYFSI